MNQIKIMKDVGRMKLVMVITIIQNLGQMTNTTDQFRFNPNFGNFAGQNVLNVATMAFDPFNGFGYYTAATKSSVPWIRRWGLNHALAQQINSEVKTASDIGKNLASNFTEVRTILVLSETPAPKGNTWTLWDSYPLSKPQLSTREQLGLSKGAVGDLNKFQKDALDDFSSFFSSGKYRNKFVFNTKTKKFEYVSQMQPYHVNGQQVYINQPGAEIRRDFIRSFGGQSSYFPEYNRASLHMKPKDEQGKPYSGAKWGEMQANVKPETRSTSIVLTSPRVDALTSILDPTPEEKEFISQLPNRINKQSMRKFWSNLDEITRPGTYLSGDQDTPPLGVQLQTVSEEPFGLSKVYKSLLDDSYDLVKDQDGSSFERFGLSPDSYYSIVRQGQRPKHSLRFSRHSFGKLNSSAVDNADLYQIWKAAKTPEQKQQFIKTWNDRIYPNSAFIDSKGNIQFLHPFVYYKKLGGRMKVIQRKYKKLK